MKKESDHLDQNDNSFDNNQSCPAQIEEDITLSRNQKEIRTAKSQQFKSQEIHQYNKLNQNQKQDIKNQTKRNFGIPQKAISQKKVEMKLLQYKGTDFGCQKVQSVEFTEEYQQSCKSASKSKKGSQNQIQQPSSAKKNRKLKEQQNELQKKIKQDQIKQERLNVLVAGGQDTGKTTFIKCFKKKQKKGKQFHIRSRTKQIKYEGGVIDQNLVNTRNSVYFVDLPGFSFGEQKKYIKEIEKYAKNQTERYISRVEEDTRIHCCLYFIRGPRIKQNDLQIMKKLSQIFNLIPLIAKSDNYTKQQIKEIKEQIFKKSKEFNIKFYDLQSYISIQYNGQEKKSIMSSKFGKFPPFAVTSSQQKQVGDAQYFVRRYPWGKVQIQNEEHTQFEKLCNMLEVRIKRHLINNCIQDIQDQDQESEKVEVVEGVIQNEDVREQENQLRARLSRTVKTNWILGSLLVGLVMTCYIRSKK